MDDSQIKYYRVYRNDTSVTEVQDSYIGPSLPGKFTEGTRYSLPLTGMFYQYTDRIHAMEMAKKGALEYIELMIKHVEKDIKTLTQYREDHYEDLNVTLIDSNIRRLEREMHIK